MTLLNLKNLAPDVKLIQQKRLKSLFVEFLPIYEKFSKIVLSHLDASKLYTTLFLILDST